MNKKVGRVILDVPFKDKDKAKELGAWWDPDIKKWFVPAGKDSAVFSEWFVREKSGSDGEERSVG